MAALALCNVKRRKNRAETLQRMNSSVLTQVQLAPQEKVLRDLLGRPHD